jgi:two-component system response regulator HydG
MAHILLIEDDRTFSRIVEGFLSKNHYQVSVSYSGKEGLKLFNEHPFEIVLLDYRLPDFTGLEVLEELKKRNPNVLVIIMTSFSDIRTAVKAIQSGALEYITKPVNPDELLMLLKEALTSKVQLAHSEDEVPVADFVEGKSDVSKRLLEHVRLVAPTDLSVIIQGESGTGKEQVARSIHQLSKRAHKPFVAVDCGALSKDLAASELFGHVKGAFTGAIYDKKGQFEAAQGGTLFMDEVGNLSYEVQIKLLRAIQERVIQPVGSIKEIKIDVRIITATNDDLYEKSKQGAFREDLYHRLNEFKLELPPLRARREDLDEFIEFFRIKANEELARATIGFSPDLIAILKKYDWPGNLREMKNVIKRSVLLTQGSIIQADTLPSEMIASISQSTTAPPENPYDLKALQEMNERDYIIKILQEVKYNKSKAARLLNIDRKTLYMKMDKYKIE